MIIVNVEELANGSKETGTIKSILQQKTKPLALTIKRATPPITGPFPK
jgi:hypothetical protein